MSRTRLIVLLLLTAPAFAQNWSNFLDPSRAIDWTTAGFSIPNYSVNCSVQPSLVAGSGNATANTTSIVNALNSCDATHNVVNIPTGTWHTNLIVYPNHGQQVLRGAGPQLTTITLHSTGGCAGGIGNQGICMHDSNGTYNGNANVLPPSGSTQCMWTAGFAQGTTSITLSSCGGTPPNGKLIILDQANDTSDTSGVYICQQNNSTNCNNNGTGNNAGRVIGGVSYSQQQVTKVTNVVSLGGGSYTVTISPGVYFSNVRIGQTPGAWWPGFTQLNGVENMTLDGSLLDGGTVAMGQCYQCWVKNVVSTFAHRNHVGLYMSLDDVVRDSYFYQAQNHSSSSYGVEFEETSQGLVENNIMQQTVAPVIFGQGSGNVVGYNFDINNIYTGNGSNPPDVLQPAGGSHNSGNEMNLWEGNIGQGIIIDNVWGSSSQSTFYRNAMSGWQKQFPGSAAVCGANLCESTPFIIRAFNRGHNYVGNIMGQPSFNVAYEMYATGSTLSGAVNGSEDSAIFSLGFGAGGFGGATNGACTGVGSSTQCDGLTRSSLMRWGNYDTVNNAVRFDSTEASPGAITYLSANFTAGYFTGLAHTLPSSLYYNSTPSWWTGGKAFPAIGPDVSTGNVSTCNGGTYAKSRATTSGQCTGGSLTVASSTSGGWASHVISNPAFDCYLSLNGPPDGSGSVLAFDGATCYSGSSIPVVSLSSTSLLFGRQLVNTPTATQTVTLTNAGGATLNISSIALTTGTQFAITANTCSSTLAASFSCTFTIRMTPLSLGAKSDSVVITTDASTSPDHVTLSGAGIPAAQVFDFNGPVANELCTNSNTGTGITTPDFIASHGYPTVRYWVQPTAHNGHFYKVTTPGTTTTEPSWPTGSGSTVTSGSVTFTEHATNAGECLDEFFLYVLPNIDGSVLGFNAVDLDPSNGGGTGQAAGGYTFTNMDSTINSFVGAAEWGVQDGIVVLTRPGTYHSPNSWTPTYWMNATYAATLGAAANNSCYCNGYPGDKAGGTNACSNDGDVTGVPVPFDIPYQTAYNALIAAENAHVKGATYHTSVAYARYGISIGGEAFPFCASQMKQKYSYSTAQFKTAWTGAVQSIADQILATTPNFLMDGALSGLCVPGTVPCVVGYDWADAEAAIYTNDGIGIASQGLTVADVNAFANNGYASGGSASVAGTYCSNDFCYNFHQFPAAAISTLQEGTVSNPTGAGTGSLVDLASFATQQQADALEVYNQDLMIAFNPNYPQYSTYHTAYALAISNFRASIAGATSVPNGINGSGAAAGSSIISGTPITCGPPDFLCSRTDSITAPLASIPNVGGLTGTNTVVTDDLGNGNRIIRISDASFDPSRANHEIVSTSSGSGDENLFSRMVARSGDNHYLLCIQNDGTRAYVVDFDDTAFSTSRPYAATFASTGGIILNAAGCNWAWTSNKAYQVNGNLLQSWDFTDWLSGPQTTPPTAVNVFDFTELTNGLPNFGAGNCLPSGYTATTWITDAGHSVDDAVYAAGFSIAGGQGTGFKVAAYKAGSGCSALDTSTWTVTGDFGATGSVISPPAAFTLHNAKIFKGGQWLLFDCQHAIPSGSCPTGGPFAWQIGTLNVVALAQGSSGGHFTEGNLAWVNGSNGTPCQMSSRSVLAPASPVNVFGTGRIPSAASYPCDFHAGWNNVNASDSNPFLMTLYQQGANLNGIVSTSGTAVTWARGHVFDPSWTGSIQISGTTYTLSSCSSTTSCTLTTSAGTQSNVAFSFAPYSYAWTGELVAASPKSGISNRFTHTFSSGTDAQIFDAGFVIGSVSQDAKLYLFTSDWLGGLGSNAGGSSCTTTTNCRSDDFIVELR